MELSENLKPRLDPPAGESQQDRLARASEMAPGGELEPNDDAESQMRKALGLLGDGQRHRPDQERGEPSNRMGDRFNGGLHRRRFVQDGDIPVTVLRRDQGHEAPVHRGTAPAAAPTSSRLQRAESALAAEIAARERAERSLADAQALARDLQTKIGHADLTKNEAIEALRLEREVLAQVRADVGVRDERLQEALGKARHVEQSASAYQDQLVDERNARKIAEKERRAAEAARDAAERMVQDLLQDGNTHRRVDTSRPRPEPEVAVTNAKRQRAREVQAVEPEPVKWWLNTKQAPKRR